MLCQFIFELVCVLISIAFVHSIAQEGFDYMYRTVNKSKKESNKPSQEIGNPQPSKTSATLDKHTDNSSNDPRSATLDKRKCEQLHMHNCTEFVAYTQCISICYTRIAPLEVQHVYSTLYKDRKVSYPPSHGCKPSSKRADAVYALATTVQPDGATL